jgi:hypothetical protein
MTPPNGSGSGFYEVLGRKERAKPEEEVGRKARTKAEHISVQEPLYWEEVP